MSYLLQNQWKRRVSEHSTLRELICDSGYMPDEVYILLSGQICIIYSTFSGGERDIYDNRFMA